MKKLFFFCLLIFIVTGLHANKYKPVTSNVNSVEINSVTGVFQFSVNYLFHDSVSLSNDIEIIAPNGWNVIIFNPAQNEIHCVLPENEDYENVVYNAVSSVVTLSPASCRINSVEMLTTVGPVRTLNISLLPPGIYFIEARGERVLRGKFVKE